MTDAPQTTHESVESLALPATSGEEASPRQVYLLHLLDVAGGRLTRGDLNKKLQPKAAAAVGLSKESADGVLQRCAMSGEIQTEHVRGSVAYRLTDAGKARLEALKELLPERRPNMRNQIVAPATETIQTYRTSYLLLQVLTAPGHSLSEANAGKQLDTYAREGLELNAATAKAHCKELASQGLLTRLGEGKAARYAITPAGRLKLASAEFPIDRKFTLTGQTLNSLLECAREVGKQFAAAPGDERLPSDDDLERSVLAAFEELRRERHAVTGLVPIHEVRELVRKRHGEEAGRHDVFDEAVLRLWRAKKVGLTPIADHGKATPAQLQDAIPGMGETLFYLEVAHDPALV